MKSGGQTVGKGNQQPHYPSFSVLLVLVHSCWPEPKKKRECRGFGVRTKALNVINILPPKTPERMLRPSCLLEYSFPS